MARESKATRCHFFLRAPHLRRWRIALQLSASKRRASRLKILILRYQNARFCDRMAINRCEIELPIWSLRGTDTLEYSLLSSATRGEGVFVARLEFNRATDWDSAGGRHRRSIGIDRFGVITVAFVRVLPTLRKVRGIVSVTKRRDVEPFAVSQRGGCRRRRFVRLNHRSSANVSLNRRECTHSSCGSRARLQSNGTINVSLSQSLPAIKIYDRRRRGSRRFIPLLSTCLETRVSRRARDIRIRASSRFKKKKVRLRIA